MPAGRTGHRWAVDPDVDLPTRRGGDVVVITNEGVGVAPLHHREVYDRVVGALGLDPDDVAEVRVGERGIAVDAIDFEDPDWPLHTLTIGQPCPRVGTGAAARRPAVPGAGS